MIQTVDIEIRERLSDYIAGRTKLRQFQEWFIPMAWDLAEKGDEQSRSIANQIEARLAEFTSGHWTEEELKDLLRSLPYTMTFAYHSDGPRMTGASEASQIIDPLTA